MKPKFSKTAKNLVIAAAATLFLGASVSRLGAAFVYDSGGELLSSGDFNGDGIADIVVLDKATGNARVGYLDTNGTISWSAPLISGVENATSLAVGNFLAPNLDCIAVTAPGFNAVNLVSLSNSNTAATPVVVTPAGVGPHALVTVPNPQGLASPGATTLLVASSDNGASLEQIELRQVASGASTLTQQFSESGAFDLGNTLQLPGANSPDYAAGIARGDTDRFDILEFTNIPGGVLISLTNLPSGSAYAFGTFDSESLPRIIFYQSGASNLIIVALITNSGVLAFGTNISVPLSESIQSVCFLTLSNSGSALIQFRDGVEALTIAGGVPSPGVIYRSGMGATNNAFTGIIPLASGQFALLDGPPGSASSTHAQIVNFNGTNFTPVSSSSLPSISTRATRANVWLFQNEPFVNTDPEFISSYDLPDWSDGVVSLTATISVTGETDGGSSTGLNSLSTNNLGARPAAANYLLPNQYRDTISVFSYAPPRLPSPVSVTISPSPGIFSGPIQLSLSSLSVSDRLFYRAASDDGWHPYVAAFQLTNSSTVQYYGTNSSGARSLLSSAAYFIASSIPPVPSYNLTNGTQSTNVTNSISSSNLVVLSKGGTIFYGRVNLSGGSIWAINLDGSGDTYITTGARPRASRDGRYLAFSRGANVFGASGGDVWVRDMQTGVEREIFPNQPPIVEYDWDSANPPSLLLDAGCDFWKVDLTGAASIFSVSHDCNDNSPVINPVDGRIAFENLTITSTNLGGIYVASPDGTSLRHVLSAGPGARWPAWSPDGKRLSFGFLASPFISAGRLDMFTVNDDGTSASEISAHTNSVDGFPHGAIWSPLGNALIGAGTINATNGLWVVPLTPDSQHCDCPAILLPTSTGDPIDFAGSIVSAPEIVVATPGLFITLEPDAVLVYWSTNYQGFGLEYTTNLGANASWTAVSGPYFLNGGNFEYHESRESLLSTKYFRLTYPSVVLLTPAQPAISPSYQLQGNQVVFDWSTNYVGYTLETTTNLRAPVVWSPFTNGSVIVTNGHIELREAVDQNRPSEFFRLRWP